MVADLIEAIEVALDRLMALLAKSDQADWNAKLRPLKARLPAEPEQTARDIMELFGSERFHELSFTRNGVAYTEPDSIEREEAFEFAALKPRLYEHALALWNQLAPPPDEPLDENIEKLADYRGGCEVWRVGKRFFLRYDCGAHVSKWRDDEISRIEARQAALGPKHFYFVIISIQRQLEARGIDAFSANTVLADQFGIE